MKNDLGDLPEKHYSIISQSLSTWSRKNVTWVMISHKLGDLLDEFPPIRQVSTKTWVRLAVIAHAEVTSQDRMSIPVAVRRMKLSGLLTKDGPFLVYQNSKGPGKRFIFPFDTDLLRRTIQAGVQ